MTAGNGNSVFYRNKTESAVPHRSWIEERKRHTTRTQLRLTINRPTRWSSALTPTPFLLPSPQQLIETPNSTALTKSPPLSAWLTPQPTPRSDSINRSIDRPTVSSEPERATPDDHAAIPPSGEASHPPHVNHTGPPLPNTPPQPPAHIITPHQILGTVHPPP